MAFSLKIKRMHFVGVLFVCLISFLKRNKNNLLLKTPVMLWIFICLYSILGDQF